MTPGFHTLHDVDQSIIHADELADIVAVHDLEGHGVDTWTHPDTGANWLRDFVPRTIPAARIITYAYTATVDDFFGPKSADFLDREAATFVQSLYANRRFAGTLHRPIIFVCHGLGGVLVKKALVYAFSRTADKVSHLFDVYTSTFAILFFGTPHSHAKASSWTNGSQAQSSLEVVSTFRAVSSEFSHHVKSFQLFFFWEVHKTASKDRLESVVDYASAVMPLDNTEESGIHANHASMVKFKNPDCSSYRTVIAALIRYCERAIASIGHRLEQAEAHLRALRRGEAYEISGILFDIHQTERPILPQPVAREPAQFHPPVSAVDHFIGRKELLHTIKEKLFDTIAGQAPSRRSFVIHGMGGSGKTQLSSKFAHAHRKSYRTVFTIHATSLKTIESSYQKIATMGGLHPTESAGRHFLEQQNQTWLLIIDNADEPTLDLESLFPKSSCCHILVTTRNPRFKQKGTMGWLELKGLMEHEALELLLTRAEIPRPWDVRTTKTGNDITRSLGYLALAVVHAGNCICHQLCTLSTYLDMHASTRAMIQRLGLACLMSTTEGLREEEDLVGAVYSTFEMSLTQLERKQTTKSRDAIEILHISAFYHFDEIPERIFTRAVTNRRKSGQASRPCRNYLGISSPGDKLPHFLIDDSDRLSESRVTWALDDLQTSALITRNAERGTYSLHPLVHQWAADRLSSTRRSGWLSSALNTLLEAVALPDQKDGASEEGGEKANTLFHQSILPHLTTCLDAHGDPMSDLAQRASWLPMLLWSCLTPDRPHSVRAEILNAGKCAVVFGERGQFEKAAAYLEAVVKALLRLRGLYDETTLTITSHLAHMYWGLGQLERSINLGNRAVQARSYLYGINDKSTLQAMSALGQTYWLHGDYIRSLAILAETSDRMKDVLGEDDLHTMTALDNYGVSLGSWRRFEESWQIHKKVLTAREARLGAEHADTLSTKMNLGMALLDLQRFDDAKAMLEDVYHKRQQLLGKEHPWTLWALCYLCKISIEMGLLDKAVEQLSWGIEAAVRSLGAGHLGVLMGKGYLALAYSRQGKLDQAAALSSETLSAMETNRGLAHPDTIHCMWKMASLYRMQNRTEEAIQMCEKALKATELRISCDHPLTKDVARLLDTLKDDLNSNHAPIGTATDEMKVRQRSLRKHLSW